jgi:cell wall integrity and stress response component
LQSSTTTSSGSVTFETNSGGQVKTITVSDSTSTSGADAGADSASADASAAGGSKLSGGSIAGVVIGVLGGLALIGALVFMIFFYRKRARSVSPIPSQDMADNRGSRGSSFGWPQGADADAGGAVPGRSATFTDRRMKPNAVLYPNGPRDSSVSLQDNEDYSRPVLRVCRPLSPLLI